MMSKGFLVDASWDDPANDESGTAELTIRDVGTGNADDTTVQIDMDYDHRSIILTGPEAKALHEALGEILSRYNF